MRKCKVTERKTSFGHRVAHCKIKSNRTFKANMISKRIWVEDLGKFVKLKISARGLKTIDKKGTSFLVDQGII